MKFQEYLEKVQQSAPEDYPEITDLVNRHKILDATHAESTAAQQEKETLNERERQLLNTYTKEQVLQRSLKGFSRIRS